MKASVNLKSLDEALAPLRNRWRQLQSSFDKRQPRERLLMIVVGVALCAAVGDALWLAPAGAAQKAARTTLQQALDTQTRLHLDAQQLGTLANTQGQLRRAEVAAWRQRTREGEAVLRGHEDTLVGPDQMMELLEQVLARHGQIRVTGMRSLERSDLLAEAGRPTAGASATPSQAPAPGAAAAASPTAPGAPPAVPEPSGAAQAAAQAPGPSGMRLGSTPGSAGATQVAQPAPGAASAPGAGHQSLYRHGVELVLEGSYTDLLAYLQALEAMPQHVLWGGLSLKVLQHPTTQLTVRLYTVSRDRHWLEI